MVRAQNKRELLIVLLLALLMNAACATVTDDSGAAPSSTQVDSAGQEASGEKATGGEEQEEAAAVPDTIDSPVTLKFMAPWDEESFQARVKDPVEAHFPNVTMELVSEVVDSQPLQETFAQGIVPDILLAHRGFAVLRDADMLFPLDDLVQAHQLDLSSIRSGAIDLVRARDPEGKRRLLGLPMEEIMNAVFYNKAIFDQFGVPYPTDGMTWDDIIDLARQVTGQRDGTAYRGLVFSAFQTTVPLMQLSAQGVGQDGSVNFASNPDFAEYYELMRKIKDIPGNYPPDSKATFANQQVAMLVTSINSFETYIKEEGLDFDVVSLPSWPDRPGIGPFANPFSYTISPHSEHKDEAFIVLKYLLTEEMQTSLHRAASGTVLDKPVLYEQFGADKITDGRTFHFHNVYLKQANPPEFSRYDPESKFYAFLRDKFAEFLRTTDDTNTFLRKIEDEYSALLKEQLAAQ